jgi:hypothetical protein
VIWVRRKQKYFCKRGWTEDQVICPAGGLQVSFDDRMSKNDGWRTEQIGNGKAARKIPARERILER